MLVQGDCYEIIPTLPDNSIDLAITDPPYNFDGQVHGGGMFDPFMGSGSTGIACLNNKRNFIGIEKNEEYFNLASERIKARQDEINGVGTLFGEAI